MKLYKRAVISIFKFLNIAGQRPAAFTHEHDLQTVKYFICQNFSCLNRITSQEIKKFDTIIY